jgi:LAO/AO transport system kinase
MHDLSKRVLEKEPRAVARVLRLIDDRTAPFSGILKDLFPHTGKAYVVGVTGNPGAGKSTLTDRLIEVYRKQEKTVGVIAVDPSSPFSGGAILGDRIRMQRHAEDPGVFIRSVATRGHLGGLSRSARDMVRVLDAYGVDVVLVETVGVGQDELEITRTAHTTLVVVAPGMGDEVQAIKAGILECADVFAVNKADRDGADGAVRDLELMIALGSEAMVAAGKRRGHVVHGMAGANAGAGAGAGWTPPIVRCISTRGEGVAALVEGLERHKAWLDGSEAGRARRRTRLAEEVREGLREALVDAAVLALGELIEEAVKKVDAREVDPYTATEELVAAFREGREASRG